MTNRRRTDGRTCIDDSSAIQGVANEAGMYI